MYWLKPMKFLSLYGNQVRKRNMQPQNFCGSPSVRDRIRLFRGRRLNRLPLDFSCLQFCYVSNKEIKGNFYTCFDKMVTHVRHCLFINVIAIHFNKLTVPVNIFSDFITTGDFGWILSHYSKFTFANLVHFSLRILRLFRALWWIWSSTLPRDTFQGRSERSS